MAADLDRYPSNHRLRHMDKALDFSFVLEVVVDRYNLWGGRPAGQRELQ